MQCAKQLQAHVLLHPTVGMTKPGDVHYYARVHCYQAVRRHFPHNLAILSLLPLAMRMAGPREALWHAIVHQNYGCSHMIVGPKHAGPPPLESDETPYYEAAESRTLIDAHACGRNLGLTDPCSYLDFLQVTLFHIQESPPSRS